MTSDPRRRRTLQRYAIAISIFSVFYNTAEGVVSIVFGAESSSRALVFYGLQSAVEVISAVLVTWRFIDVVRPGDERRTIKSSPHVIRIERIVTTTIGVLLVALAFAAFGTSAAALVVRDRPSTDLPALLIAATATALMLALYLAKRFLARALDSSAMNSEAMCSLGCMELSIVLLVGSLVYRVWGGGWWVDGATTIAIGTLFGWEGVKMIRWARNEAFDGGCCESCRPRDKGTPAEEVQNRGSEQKPSPCSLPTQCCGGNPGKENETVREEIEMQERPKGKVGSCALSAQCCTSGNSCSKKEDNECLIQSRPLEEIEIHEEPRAKSNSCAPSIESCSGCTKGEAPVTGEQAC